MEFRLKVPADRATDAGFIAHTEATVREHLSRCHCRDDGLELVDAVVITRRDSREGGFWIHGSLDAPVFDSFEPVPDDELAGLRAAREVEPADLDPWELREHMIRKAER